MILSSWLAPDFADQYYDQFIKDLQASDKPQAEIEALIAKYEGIKKCIKIHWYE
jgi:hypothetical protein